MLIDRERRKFLVETTKIGCYALCGNVIAGIFSGCEPVDNGDPVINITKNPVLLNNSGAIKKRYSKLNDGRPILIIRESQLQFVVYSALCTHKGVEVNLPKNGVIVCPNHGSRFRINDGQVVDGQAIEPLHQFHTHFDASTNLLTIGYQ